MKGRPLIGAGLALFVGLVIFAFAISGDESIRAILWHPAFAVALVVFGVLTLRSVRIRRRARDRSREDAASRDSR